MAQGLPARLESRVDSVFKDMATAHTPGCALSVMEEGQPVFQKGYGMANLEYVFARRTPIKSLEPLLKLTKLEVLDLRDTVVQEAEIKRFQTAVPKCNVLRSR